MGRCFVETNLLRVDNRDTFFGDEPKFSVSGLEGWIPGKFIVKFEAFHAVGDPERNTVNSIYFTTGKAIQFMFADPENAAVAH